MAQSKNMILLWLCAEAIFLKPKIIFPRPRTSSKAHYSC
ncbi:hypothetical protein CCACVL1_09228 [Corchorus capsularis]|uniref:Uncharacterized protein n=1 Tax=Corchorus capsularis TaxID=210143 RepID=A0A1R3IXA5_COCAP|nr:hypothetical protein CCACVL1_09228 [Corchorus capsularis]